VHIFDNLVADILWEEGQSFCTQSLSGGSGGGMEADVVAIFFFFRLRLGAFIFSAPTEAEPSIIVPDAGDGMDSGCISLDGANLPLGERLVMDAAAALVRDENN
jgi:hypothetical protein